jgi:Winged helix DNA-binding domain
LTGLREVVDRLRPRLRTYRDGAGRELFDIADGPIADEDVPAPIRFLPQYDNVFLSHEDRSRILVDDVTIDELAWKGGVLIDGYLSAAWRIRRDKKASTMTVTLYVPVTGEQRVGIEAEGERLLAFMSPDADSRAIQLVERA